MNIKEEKKLTKKEQALLRRNQIIDTAMELFGRQGYSRTTIKDISEATGTSMGLMYHYFASKEELLAAVFERHSYIAPLRSTLTISNTKPVREVLYAIANGFYDLLVSKQDLVNIIFNEIRINPAFNKTWSIIPAEGIKIISDYLTINIASGKLKLHNTEVAARSMLYMVIMHIITRDVFPQGNLSAKQYFKETIDIFLDGIAVQPMTNK